MSLDVLFVVVGLNSSRLLLKEEVRLVVGFCGEGGGWLWGWGSLVAPQNQPLPLPLSPTLSITPCMPRTGSVLWGYS